MENKPKPSNNSKQCASLYEKGAVSHLLGNYQEAISFFNEMLKIDNWNEYALGAKRDALVAMEGDTNIIKYLSYKLGILSREHNEEIYGDDDRKGLRREYKHKVDNGKIDERDEYGGLDPDDWVSEQAEKHEVERLREIIIESDEGLKLNPQDIEVMRSKAWALYLLGEGRQAFDSYDEIINLNPDYPIKNFIDDIEHLK